jgi:hypothetical protein
VRAAVHGEGTQEMEATHGAGAEQEAEVGNDASGAGRRRDGAMGGRAGRARGHDRRDACLATAATRGGGQSSGKRRSLRGRGWPWRGRRSTWWRRSLGSSGWRRGRDAGKRLGWKKDAGGGCEEPEKGSAVALQARGWGASRAGKRGGMPETRLAGGGQAREEEGGARAPEEKRGDELRAARSGLDQGKGSGDGEGEHRDPIAFGKEKEGGGCKTTRGGFGLVRVSVEGPSWARRWAAGWVWSWPGRLGACLPFFINSFLLLFCCLFLKPFKIVFI